MNDRQPFLVLGLGNELFTDEGVGVVAARRVEALGLQGVEVIDGGTLGLALLPEISDRDGVLVIDAMVADGAMPGDVMVLADGELSGSRQLLFSAHQVGLSEVLAAAELAGRAPDRVGAVGVVPASLETGYGLTSVATAAIEEMVKAATSMLAAWGVTEAVHA